MRIIYPTLAEVDAADHERICRWYRFLPAPGSWAVGTPAFGDAFYQECAVLNRITARLDQLGGFTVEISKAIGWGP